MSEEATSSGAAQEARNVFFEEALANSKERAKIFLAQQRANRTNVVGTITTTNPEAALLHVHGDIVADSGLSQNALQLIDRIAGAIGAKVAENLGSVTDMLDHAVPYHPPPPHLTRRVRAYQKQWEQEFYEELNDMLGGMDLSRLLVGVRKTIFVAVGPINGARFQNPFRANEIFERPRPESGLPTSTEGLRKCKHSSPLRSPLDHRTVIPGKLLTRDAGASASFEPSTQFKTVLTKATSSAIYSAVRAKEHVVFEVYRRELVLHSFTNPTQTDLCPFLLAEQDFEWARVLGTKQVIEFEWDCPTCGGRHALQVVE